MTINTDRLIVMPILISVNSRAAQTSVTLYYRPVNPQRGH